MKRKNSVCMLFIVLCYFIFFAGVMLRGAELKDFKPGVCFQINNYQYKHKIRILKVTDTYVSVFACQEKIGMRFCSKRTLLIKDIKDYMHGVTIVPCT